MGNNSFPIQGQQKLSSAGKIRSNNPADLIAVLGGLHDLPGLPAIADGVNFGSQSHFERMIFENMHSRKFIQRESFSGS